MTLMQRVFQGQALWVALFASIWLGVAGLFAFTAHAQVGYDVVTPSGSTIAISAWDQTREKDSVVLFTSDYGPTTRTNAYGVELVLLPVAGQEGVYTVQPQPSLSACMNGEGLANCGNLPIPERGIILSAHGNKKALLNQLTPGSRITLKPRWFEHASKAISRINPTPANNGSACSFPGCRGGGQLVIYSPNIGRDKTGTNEFGFETTVLNGRVAAQEGSDSTIPPGGFVLSGHGSSRDWLINHAPIGAAVQLSGDGAVVTTTVDAESYRMQLMARIQHAEQRRLCGTWYLPRKPEENPCEKTLAAMASADALLNSGQAEAAADRYHELTVKLNQEIWDSHMPFPETAVKGVWHRPVEQSRAEVARTLDFLRNSGLNTVFLETYFHGYTIYPSQTMAKYGLPVKNPVFTTLEDPLAVWVEEAHRRGMQLHTWMEVFYAGNKVAPPSTDAAVGPILGKYPQWGNINYAGRNGGSPSLSTLESGAYFLDPANTEAKAFLLALIEETATRYAIDGLQLDYIRYPASLKKESAAYLSSSWGFTPAARQQFIALGGVDPNTFTNASISKEHAAAWTAWQNFKINQVSQFVSTVNTRLDAVVTRPGFKISAAIFPREEDSIARKQQDWPTWVANGWVDMLCPMTLTSALKVIAVDTAHVVRIRNGSNPNLKVVSGIFGPFNGNEADLILEQIDVARGNNADGFSLFDSAHLTGRVGKAIRLAQRK